MGTTYSFCCGCCCGCCARCGVGLPRLPRFAPVVGDTDGDDGGDSEALPVATAAAFGPRSPSGGATAPIHALCGTWYVTHSTLDMWSKNTHPRITYDLLGAASEATSLTGAKGGAGTAGPVVLRDTVVYRVRTRSAPCARSWAPCVRALSGGGVPPTVRVHVPPRSLATCASWPTPASSRAARHVQQGRSACACARVVCAPSHEGAAHRPYACHGAAARPRTPRSLPRCARPRAARRAPAATGA